MKTISIVMAVILFMFSGCAAQTNSPADGLQTPVQAEGAAPVDAAEEGTTTEENMPETDNNEMEDKMRLLIGETEVPVTWEENASVEALRELCKDDHLTIQMSMYGGFEQVGPIGQSIVRDDVQTNTNYGDIVLYSGNQIVIFYGSNSWSYTRLGHVDLSQQEMGELLSNGDVNITLK